MQYIIRNVYCAENIVIRSQRFNLTSEFNELKCEHFISYITMKKEQPVILPPQVTFHKFAGMSIKHTWPLTIEISKP